MSFFRVMRSALVILLCLFLLPVAPAGAAKKKTVKKAAPYRVSANAALLFEESGWHKYYSRNIEKKVFPASTTKLMTALIVLQRKRLNDIVTIGPRALRALPSKIEVRVGEKYRIRDLLYAILLNSANDASVALAESVAGSEEAFVDLMNKRARQLGAKNTLFANSHGLPSDTPQYTTAHDMFLIFREALKNEFFREAIKIRTMSIHSQGGRQVFLKSHNKSLFKGWKESVYGKTGYTRAAQACFVGRVVKGRKKMIVAVFGCPGSTRWDDVKHIIEKYGGVDL